MQINTYKNHEYGNKTYVIYVILVLKTVHINTNKQTFKQLFRQTLGQFMTIYESNVKCIHFKFSLEAEHINSNNELII